MMLLSAWLKAIRKRMNWSTRIQKTHAPAQDIWRLKSNAEQLENRELLAATAVILANDFGARHGVQFLNDLFFPGAEGALWRTDGTPGGTTKVFGPPDPALFSYVARVLGAGSGSLYFTGNTPGLTEQIFSTSGSGANYLGEAYISDFEIVGNSMYIGSEGHIAFNGVPDSGWLLKTDGGTLQDLYEIAPTFDLATIGSTVYFASAVVNGSPGTGGVPGLWTTDGTLDGTHLIWNGLNGDVLGDGALQHTSTGLTNFNGRLYFFGAHHASLKPQLFMLGDDNRPVQVTAAGPDGFTAGTFGPFTAPFVAGGSMYFAGRLTAGPNAGDYLVRSNGSGVQLLRKFSPVGFFSGPELKNFVEINGNVFFSGVDGVRHPDGSEENHTGLFVTGAGMDGATELLPRFEPYSGMVAAGGRLWFQGYSQDRGYELWTSDGTAAGTFVAIDLVPGAESSGPSLVGAIGNTLIFSANRPSDGGQKLYSLDISTVTGPPDAGHFAIRATNAVREEGNSDSTPFTFTVTRTISTSGSASMTYTVTGTGTQPADSDDFAEMSGTVSFADGESSQTITVNVTGDEVSEFDEGFTVTLSNPSLDATITTATASGLILDDELNHAPTVLNPIFDQEAGSNVEFFFTVPGDAFADDDVDDTLTYSATQADGSELPSWLSFDADTGEFYGVPEDADAGFVSIELTATDSYGDSASTTFSLAVLIDAVYTATGNAVLNATTVLHEFDGLVGGVLQVKINNVIDTRYDGIDPSWFRSLTINGANGADKIDISGLDDDDFYYRLRSIVLNGGAGNDTIIGSFIDDSITGGAGNDSLKGGVGNDTYYFSAAAAAETDTVVELTDQGDDWLDFSALASTVPVTVNLTVDATLARHTNRTVKTGAAGQAANFENVVGGEGNDSLTGNNANNVFHGRGGNDTLVGNAGFDALFGDAGNDSLLGGNDSDDMLGGLGNDTLNGNAGDDYLDGEDGQDSLLGEIGDDWLIGGLANDTLVGGAGSDDMFGAEGDDTYIFAVATTEEVDSATEYPGYGTDRWDFSALPATTGLFVDLTLRDEPNVIHANRTVGVFSFIDEDDNVEYGDEIEIVIGGAGNDSITGNDLSNRLDGGAGNDTITGNGGNDTLIGGAGSDALVGGWDDDVYVFSAATAAETDTLTEFEDEGADRLDFSALAAAVTVLGNLGSDAELSKHTNRVVRTSAAGQAASFENITGGAGGDKLTGNASANRLDGGGGNDSLVTGLGDDTLLGGAGSDTLVGGDGDDVYLFTTATPTEADVVAELAENGLDWLDFSSLAATVNVTVNLTSDTALASHAGRTLKTQATGQAANFEGVIGGAGNDSLTGNNGRNEFYGGGGNDTLIGNLGDDDLNGEMGHDSLVGGGGDDGLYGGGGNDTLNGGGGSDYLFGEAGDDGYFFAAATDPEFDSIGELLDEGTDRLDFSALSATTAVTVDLTNPDEIAAHTNRTISAYARTIDDEGTRLYFDAFEAVIGGAGNDSITGNDLHNRLDGGAGNDTLMANEGHDTLTGGSGNDALLGGAGDDVYSFAAATAAETDSLTELTDEGTDQLDFSALAAGVSVLGNLGSDTLATHASRTIRTGVAGQFVNFENITGGAGPDKLTGNAGNNRLDGGGGTDSLTGLGGHDTLLGGAANDTLIGGAGDDMYVFATAVGTEADVVTELANANEGIDRLDFSTVAVAVTANLGSDTALASHTGRTVKTSAAGQAGNWENVTGGTANDVLTGNNLANQLSGGAGADKLTGGNGNDDLRGGDGLDSIIANGAVDYLLTNTLLDAHNTLAGTDSLDGIEAAALTLLATGTAAGRIDAAAFSGSGLNTLTGGNGDDVLIGGTGRDSIKGGLGNDVLTGGLGNDNLDGGTGTLDRLDEIGDVDFKLTNAALTGLGSDTLVGIETARLTGGVGNNRLDAAAFTLGVVTLDGGDGHDVLLGGSPANSLIGGAGRDLLIGGLGIDTLMGGDGEDILIGGTITAAINTPAALTAIMAEWTSAGSLAARRTNLLNGGGLNGTNKLNNITVANDSNAADRLTGDADIDWFFSANGDVLTDFDLPAGELRTTI